MKNILFINHSQKSCGVQQYGKRVANIFKGSIKYNVVYAEPTSENELSGLIQILRPTAVIYNYLSETIPWLSPESIEQIRRSGLTKQGLIVHNINYSTDFDFYLHQNPMYPQNGNNYSLLRPLFNFPQPRYEPGSRIKIGSFGFGFKIKKHDAICELVNDQFEEAEINMHLTLSYFRPNVKELDEVKELCRSKITKPGISLNFNSEFLDDEKIVESLSENDLNVFLYEHYDNYNGISSVIDYALSAKRPIAVCRSNMFAHVNDTEPSICIENSSLKSIMQNGINPIKKFHEAWSQDNFIKRLENILDSL